MNPKLLWALLFIPVQLSTLFCVVTTPLVALFIRKEPRTDRVKRLGNQTLTFDREYLIRPFYWWQTFDNAVDEYWWGMFTAKSSIKYIRELTQEQYDGHWYNRYLMRVLWMWRNPAYGFAQYPFGRNPDQTHFQIKKDVPLAFGYYNSVNIGWKAHDGFTRLMYAGRILALRKPN